MPQFGLTIDVCLRDLPFCLVGAAVSGHPFYADTPAQIAVPVALLIAFDIRVRRSRRRI
ncbi:hypothetical protein [Streptomyces sp. CS113]|uniref:hypothetical protein n=1 Tax=Streptomyces sp. CS113 TaxID=1982761 RepID=UPI0015C60AE7|nr:hypothetical protein [Streptomyces sp. CS113]